MRAAGARSRPVRARNCLGDVGDSVRRPVRDSYHSLMKSTGKIVSEIVDSPRMVTLRLPLCTQGNTH